MSPENFALFCASSGSDSRDMRRATFFKTFLHFLLFAAGGHCHAQVSLFGWGDNRYGQLGIGTFDTASPFGKAVPTSVTGISNLVGVADGFYHAAAFASDGTVWTWGYDYYGELGLGLFEITAPFGKSSPTQVPGLTNVTAVAAGTHHTLALKADGTVWSWGWNQFGQLGDGSGANKSTPIQITSLTNVRAIAAGGNHSLILKADGSVWAFGSNTYGELGDGTLLLRYTPVRVLNGAQFIACGQYHSLAIFSDGTVFAWGSNSNGQLGNGTTVSSKVTVTVQNLTHVVSIVGGAFNSLAIKSDGSVWAWGWNGFGQLGDGTTTDHSTPVAVQNLTDAIAIATGQAHSLALKSDGSVWTWGWNQYGQTGSGVFATTAPFGINTPQKLTTITGAVGIAGGGNRAHALTSTAAAVHFSGTLILDGLTLPYAAHTVNFAFRPADGSAGFLRTATLSTDRTFSLDNIPPKSYNVWIKVPKWLAKVVAADASGGDVSNAAAELTVGDANNDNYVDITDFATFINSYGGIKSDTTSGYDPASDFNEDGFNDLGDFGLLVNSYSTHGDP